ncbi:hypothetical protein E5S67_06402 [Microcoleus sp. IPMA8]|uniref:Tc1-like transposase DDE domain-containing protein n=2 Tax=Microcoleus TaxID=44471 RepID=A0ABX2D7I3_9CYAN|nr:hypothetical protein [Microcoleus asticus IPMA8]
MKNVNQMLKLRCTLTAQYPFDAQKRKTGMLPECYLLWGDVCGYVWGNKNKRIELPMTNQRERQTYFGALNYQTKEFFVREDEAGNSKNTVLFVKYLQNLNNGARILIFWDGASYHKYAEMRNDLGQVNQDAREI